MASENTLRAHPAIDRGPGTPRPSAKGSAGSRVYKGGQFLMFISKWDVRPQLVYRAWPRVSWM